MTKAPSKPHAKKAPSSLVVTRRFEGGRDAAQVLASLIQLHSGKGAAYDPSEG